MRASLLGICVSSLLSCAAAHAGAFLFPEGEGQVIVTTTFADARKAYDSRGRLVDTPRYDKFETRAYVEYGLTDWLTIVGEGGGMNFRAAGSPLDHLNQLTAEAQLGLPLSIAPTRGPHYLGVGVSAIGGRVRLLTYDDYLFSFEVSLRAATPLARRFLDMRDDVQGDARILVGKPVEVFGLAGFVDMQFGYRARGQNGDEVRADFTYGLRPWASLLLMAQSFTAASLGQRAAARFVSSQKFEVSAVYDLTKDVSVQIGVIKALGGFNTPAERGLASAVWCRF
jgi:protein XagA